MKVYILMYRGWESSHIHGIYKNFDLAYAAQMAVSEPYRTTMYDIEEYEVQTGKPKPKKKSS